MIIPDTIFEILDLARWAPSGDNTQPWRFEIVNENKFIVHGHDTREHCVYDLDGHPSQMALGALLENIAIASTGHGLRASWIRLNEFPDTAPTFEVTLETSPLKPDPLISLLKQRTVQRRAMKTNPLTDAQKKSMELAAGKGYRVLWLEGVRLRLQAALLMFANAKLRLTIREAYEVHRSIIDWNKRYSDDKVPDQALGIDQTTLKLMRWLMQDWRRVEFFNTWLAGTLAPRIQLDLIPGIACAAHFVIIAPHPPQSMDDYFQAGQSMQRLWLAATQQGLHVQPEMTPLIFSRYVREGRRFSDAPHAVMLARKLVGRLHALLGENVAVNAVFMGRIGTGPAPEARSLRLPLEQLVVGNMS